MSEGRDPGSAGGTDAFQSLVGSLDDEMFVVTASHAGERSGCLVGFATQCSIDPPRFLVCISRANHTFGVAQHAEVLVVHVLRPADRGLAERFGAETGDELAGGPEAKFDGLDVASGPGGAPVLAGVDWFAGRVVDRLDLGDHVGTVLAPFAGRAERTAEGTLGFGAVKQMEPGHPA